MKKIIFSILALAISFAMYSCKDTTGPDDTATINLRAQLEKNTVKPATIKFNEGITSSDVDSIQIKKVRILITEVKFHAYNESDDSKDKLFKAGPLLFMADSTGTSLDIASGTIPSGKYNKMKLEMHRFASSELAQYANSSLFKDFATSDRYSVIIDCVIFRGGTSYHFVYSGSPTVNMTYNFGSDIDLPSNQESNFYLIINPVDVFIKGSGELLDPTDDSNHNDIDNLIKQAIQAVKKNY